MGVEFLPWHKIPFWGSGAIKYVYREKPSYLSAEIFVIQILAWEKNYCSQGRFWDKFGVAPVLIPAAPNPHNKEILFHKLVFRVGPCGGCWKISASDILMQPRLVKFEKISERQIKKLNSFVFLENLFSSSQRLINK